MIRGLTSNTAQRLLLGAGAFYKNFNPSTDTPATATAKLLGATDGGGTFAVTNSIRQVSVDGAPNDVKGLKTSDGYTVTLTANVKEITAENIALAIGAASTTTMTSMSATKITGKDIEDSDYVANITWAGTLSGSNKPVYVVVKNALSLNGLNLTVSDKNEATLPITINGHYDLSDLDTPPYEIIYPTV